MNLAEHMLNATDEALASVVDWASKHPKDAWQVVIVEPDQEGYWSVSGLKPGSYNVVVRGTVSRLDANWGYSFDASPGSTYSVPMTHPQFYRPIR